MLRGRKTDASKMHSSARATRTLLVFCVAICACFAVPAMAQASIDVELSDLSVDLGDVDVNAPPVDFQLTLTNSAFSTGNFDYVGSELDGDFADVSINDDQCDSLTPLAPGASCDLVVTFTPSTLGLKLFQITPITSNADSTQTTDASIDIVHPAASVSWSTYNFGNVDLDAPGTYSHPLTIGNSGTGSLHITNFGLDVNDGNVFALDYSDCGAGSSFSIAAGDNCTVDVLYDPTTAGSYEGELCFNTSDYGQPEFCPTLDGAAAEQSLGAASSYNFGIVDAASQPGTIQNVQVSNTSSLPSTINSVSITGTDVADFVLQAGGCGGTLSVSGSCNVPIMFDPTTAGDKEANLHIVYGYANDTLDVPLGGTSQTFDMAKLPSVVSFGNHTPSTGASEPKSVVFTNNSSVSVSIASFTITGADASTFAFSSSTCAGTLAVGASCTANVTFNPLSVGVKSATIHVVYGFFSSTVEATLVGTGYLAAPPAPAPTVPPSDTTPTAPVPTISATPIKTAKLKKLSNVSFKVGCGQVSCMLTAATTLKFKVKRKAKSLVVVGSVAATAGGTATLSIKLTKSERKMVAAAKSAAATTTFTASGASPFKLTTKLK